MSDLILVTGANGYIAGLLIPRLLERGYRVRALARRPERLAGRTWLNKVEVVRGDVHHADGLKAALSGVHTAYYLIHSMSSGRGYTRLELEAAHRFAQAADEAGVQHIVYLGGLADPNAKNLAPHMRSRIETGQTLRAGRVPVTEFRAGVIAGPGSISFEMIRYLTECFPILPGPNWLRNRAQPIAASNVVDYLVAALDHPEGRGGIYEMGGPEVMQYANTMMRYARRRGLKRFLFTLPGVPIWLMARFVDWLTPVPYAIATPLVGGLQSDSIVLDDAAQRVFPEVKLAPYEKAIIDSLEALTPGQVEPVWEGMPGQIVRMKHEGFFIDYRHTTVEAPAEKVYSVIDSLRQDGKWLQPDWLWKWTGWISKAARRQNAPGDDVDYYRVEEAQVNRMMRLHAELWVPGDGWIEWRIEGSTLKQTGFFAPHGLGGFLYWYGLAPVHKMVFHGMIREIKQRSEET